MVRGQKMKRPEVMAITIWMNSAKDRLVGKSLVAIRAILLEEKGINAPITAISLMAIELGIYKPRTAPPIKQSQACMIMAKALVALHKELGVTVPDDLWALMAEGPEED